MCQNGIELEFELDRKSGVFLLQLECVKNQSKVRIQVRTRIRGSPCSKYTHAANRLATNFQRISAFGHREQTARMGNVN